MLGDIVYATVNESIVVESNSHCEIMLCSCGYRKVGVHDVFFFLIVH